MTLPREFSARAFRPTRRVALAWAAAATALSVGGVTRAAAADRAEPAVGAPAPAFEAVDSKGRRVRLADFAGRTVVLEWTNPECPYVAKHYVAGHMPRLQKAAKEAGVAWLMVSSAQPGGVGYLADIEAEELLEARQAVPGHFLLDHDGRMLDAFGVSVALTMAVIDPAGRLAYYGAIDDKPLARPEEVDGARNYVREALAAVARGEVPKPARTRAYGCVAR